MTYLALAHGARGLIYYCYYDLRVLPQYPQMWAWMKSIAAEVKSISPVLLSPDDRGPVLVLPSNAGLHTKLKQQGGRLYLIAVNTARTESAVTFRLGPLPAPRATVLFEHRTVPLNLNSLTDNFPPLAVHVYDLGPASSANPAP